MQDNLASTGSSRKEIKSREKNSADLKSAENLTSDNSSGESSISRKFKQILSKLSKGSLTIGNEISLLKDEEQNNTGWISFPVNMSDLGLTLADFKQTDVKSDLGRELFSNYMIDFMGELVIRTNIDKFLKIVLSMKEDEYLGFIAKDKHKRFGANLDFKNKKLVMCFHISIFQSILTEDFKHCL